MDRGSVCVSEHWPVSCGCGAEHEGASVVFIQVRDLMAVHCGAGATGHLREGAPEGRKESG